MASTSNAAIWIAAEAWIAPVRGRSSSICPAETRQKTRRCAIVRGGADTDKIDEAVLALLFLTRHDHWRAWKGFDWDALSRLHDKGMIADPVNKAKSVVFTEEGLKCAEELFRVMFTKPE